MSAEIAGELRAKLRDEWLRKATSSFTCQECGIQANFIDEIIDALDAKDKRIAELEAALRPFSTFAEHSLVLAGGNWLWRDCQHDRICDWFGPSDFGLASRLLNKEDRNG